MPLRKSPTRTPALLAALRANSLKSTGPRTARGKARSCLNALKHGRYARHLPGKLVQAGDAGGAARYQWFYQKIAATFRAVDPEERRQAAQLAAKVWCSARRVEGLGAKWECLLESKGNCSGVPFLSRIRIVDRWRRLGLVFWLQSRWLPTPGWKVKALLRRGHSAPALWDWRMERRWRLLRFRSRKPGFWEQQDLAEQLKRRVKAA